MITVSLCLIVKNEEDVLARCLSAASGIADEIVVVDTGSTDGTKAVARQFTDRVFDFAWIDDFSAARNFAFSKATMDYILWLDADDLLLPADAVKLRRLKQTLAADVDAVMMRYHTGFDEQGRVVFSYYRERLVKRSRGFVWREPVHEHLEIGGTIISADIAVTHAKQHASSGTRNIRIYEAALARGETLTPRGTYYYARELKDNGRTKDAVALFERFLDSGRGWVEDCINACGELAKCHQALHDDRAALASLLRSFEYDTPRAELCCQIGYHFKKRALYKRSAFWFRLALTLEKPAGTWGFISEDCWGYIPCLECAVCYDRLGDYATAARYNDMAGFYRPDSSAVRDNRKYFEDRLKAGQPATQGDKDDVSTDVSGHQP